MSVTVISGSAAIYSRTIRDANGIPWVVTLTAGGTVSVYDGSAASPSAFTERDTSNNPDNTQYDWMDACFIGSNTIAICYFDTNGKSSALRYVTFNTSTDTFSGDTSIYDIGDGSPVGSTSIRVRMTVDSNGIPHVVWTDLVSSMGTDYRTVMYGNRVGGSWNTAVEIDGASNTRSVAGCDIIIDDNNWPIIAYAHTVASDNGVSVAYATSNNPSSFSLHRITSGISASIYHGEICINSDGDIFIYANHQTNSQVYIHSNGDGMTTWSSTSLTTGSPSLNVAKTTTFACAGADVYLFQVANSDDDIDYEVYSGGSWSGSWTTLVTGTITYMDCRNEYWLDYDSAGNEVGEHQTTNARAEIDYAYFDNSNFVWDVLTLATTTSLTPTTGSVSYTGKQPSVSQTATTELTPTTGSLNYTGYAPQVQITYRYTPLTGSLSYTGKQPDVTLVNSLTPTTGSLSYTGYAPSISFTYRYQPATGSVTYTGYQPTLSQTTTLELTPTVGHLSYTGYAPSIQNTYRYQPATGSVTYTGYQPGVVQGTTTFIVALTGSVSYTGYAPSIQITYAYTPTTGSLSYTGYQPTLTQTTTLELTPTTGSVSYTGYAPQVQSTYRYVAQSGSVTYTGNQPGVTQTVITELTPLTGSVTYSGKQPSVSFTYAYVALTGSIVYTGYQPGLSQTTTLELTPTTGSVTYSGKQPSLLRSLAPSSGSVLYTGYQPSISQTVLTELTPTTGSVLYTGNQPGLTRSENQWLEPTTGQVLYSGNIPGVSQTSGPTAFYLQRTTHLRIAIRIGH